MKSLALTFVLCLGLGLAACGDDDSTTGSTEAGAPAAGAGGAAEKTKPKVTVPKGFDPTEIRIIGEAKGEPPFTGALRYHGWRAERAQLPTLAEGIDRAIVAPAEVEV